MRRPCLKVCTETIAFMYGGLCLSSPRDTSPLALEIMTIKPLSLILIVVSHFHVEKAP